MRECTEYLSVSVRDVSFQLQVKADGRSHTDKFIKRLVAGASLGTTY
jgi:hypothetical protein